MPTDPKLEIAAARSEVEAAGNEAAAISAQIARARRALTLAGRKEGDHQREILRSELSQLTERNVAAEARLKAARQRLDQLLATVVTSSAGQPLLAPLSGEVPILLFPVRLETRFHTAAGGTELLIRVYPDDVHIDSHEPGLTDEENEAGRRYWDQIWPAEPEGLPAWRQLAERFGAPRAAWIARTLQPTNVSARPATAPVFPNVARREAAWTRAPRAMLLPDRWIATGNGPSGRVFQVAGSPIPEILAAGPAPALDSEAPPNPESLDPTALLDEDMRWLVDFDAAVQAGMGMRVRLPAGVQKLTSLVVTGVKTTMTPDEGAKALAALVDAHHYTRSIAFAPRGTPTNNTGEEQSGFNSKDQGQERSFAAERGDPLFAAGTGTNGERAAQALGIDGEIFAHAAFAGLNDEAAARDMNAAMWATTWGYFLSRRLSGTVSADELVQFRRHFIDHVRGGGSLPTLRIGKQPYGLLPVTSLDRWAPADATDIGARATATLRNLREAFRRALEKLPRVDTTETDQSLLSVLRMSPISSAYGFRHILGPQFVDSFQTFVGVPLDAKWWAAQQELAAPTVRIPGMPSVTAQGASLESPEVTRIELPLVQFKATAGDAPPDPNYLQMLPEASIERLHEDNLLPAPERPLLYRLLRHSLLLGYADAARRIQIRARVLPAKTDPEPEMIDLGVDGAADATARNTVWLQFEKNVGPFTAGETLGVFLTSAASANSPDTAELMEARAALHGLARLPAADLERLLPETLDTCSHRMDAWITSLASKRLDTLRSKNPRGIMVGGYGWLENVEPSTARVSEGFLHAPSLAHATTTAVLASAYLSHRNRDSANPFIIDLSSARARLARYLIRGVRQGQPLSALLGYRLERALVDQNLGEYVAKLRRLATVGGPTPVADQPVESVAANNVVHGLRIVTMWKNKWRNNLEAFRAALRTSPAKFFADLPRINAIFKDLDDATDALGDLLITENVYQVAHNNFSRMGFSVESVARGEPVPEPQVLDTPRTGTAVSHRVLFISPPDAPELANWIPSNHEARAAVEPRLNALAASLLPDPSRVRCRAQYLDPRTGEAFSLAGGALFRELRLSQLQLSPLDAVFLSSSRDTSERGELDQRLIFVLDRTRPSIVPRNAEIRLNYGRDPAWGLDIVSFAEFQQATAAVRRLLTISRAMAPADFGVPYETATATLDAGEFEARAAGAVTAFRRLAQPLTSLLANESGAPLAAVRDTLMRCAYLGMQTAVPVSAAGEGEADRGALITQARAVLADLKDRIGKLDSAAAEFDRAGATPQACIEHDLSLIRILFGTDFIALPRILPNDTAELNKAFGASLALQGGDPLAATAWLQRASRVRAPLAALGDALRNTEALNGRVVPVSVAQLPFDPEDRWVALPAAAGSPIPSGRVSVVAVGAVSLANGRPVEGIVVDEWTEIVPSGRETTGVAFHFDQPAARPPQAVLLAVAPDVSKPWDMATLESVLLETLELSRIRAVDQDVMTELDHYLPALYFALNAAKDATITTNFRD